MRILLPLLLFCDGQPIENAVTRSIQFLARHQDEDGSWGKPVSGCTCRPRYPIDTPLGIPIDPEVQARFQRVVAQLADDEADVRDRAQRELQGLGAGAVPLLRRSLDHADPEVALRCREALRTIWETDPTVRTICLGLGWALEEGGEVATTGLALLCFLGAGYIHVSKNELHAPNGRILVTGTVVRKAGAWLLARQREDGSFDSRAPVAHAISAAAMCELYGMTADKKYLDPTVGAMTFLKTLKSSDPDFLVWKGIALHSAHISDVPDCPGSACDQMVDVLSREESRSAVSAALLLSMCAKRGTETLRARVADFNLKELSPLDEWMVTSAALRCGESIQQRLPVCQLRGSGCDAGSWVSPGRSWKQRLVTTLYATLTMERTYRYPCALFYWASEK